MRYYGVLLLTAASFVTAKANVVYQQNLAWTPGNSLGSLWTSHVDSSTNGWRAFDNFTLGTSATIASATWYGVYSNSAIQNGSPNTDTWQISFFDNAGGLPGTELSSTVLSPAQVHVETLGSGNFGPNFFTLYQFTADLTPFSAASGTTYWFSPWSKATNFYDFFAMPLGLGGDSSTYHIALSGGVTVDTFMRTSDRAFSLSTAPEPATWALFGSGVAALLIARRRRA